MEIQGKRSSLESIQQFAIETNSNFVVEKPQTDYRQLFLDCSKEQMEFTLAVGCPVNCSRYCPQEVFVKKYGNNERLMTFEAFKEILANLPNIVTVQFAGFCEPFVNPDFVRMAEYAQHNGYRLNVFTTLYGAKASDVERLLNLEYGIFCLHLRDGHIVNFPLTTEYKNNVFKIIEGLPNVTFSLMNKLFTSNNREKVTRGILPQPKRVGSCSKFVNPQFVVLPNGQVQLCCQDFGLQHTVGNLLKEDYADIKKRFQTRKCSYRLCEYCDWCTPYTRYLYNQLAAKVKKVAYKIT